MAEQKKKGVGPLTFFRQVRAEGSKVTWTTRAETIQASIMVLIFSVIVALFLFLADMIIGNVVRMITGVGG